MYTFLINDSSFKDEFRIYFPIVLMLSTLQVLTQFHSPTRHGVKEILIKKQKLHKISFFKNRKIILLKKLAEILFDFVFNNESTKYQLKIDFKNKMLNLKFNLMLEIFLFLRKFLYIVIIMRTLPYYSMCYLLIYFFFSKKNIHN